MKADLYLWLRAETTPHEHRTPLTPADAATLVAQGATVTVEASSDRVFPTDDYARVGCQIADFGTWRDAPPPAYVLGIKEPPAEAGALSHDHIFFGHAFKGQDGSEQLLQRFRDGGGALLDIESLVDASGRRVAAFGYWAGYVGAALAVLKSRGTLRVPLSPGTRDDLDAALDEGRSEPETALVIGAQGRGGRGACDALGRAGARVTKWDVHETRSLDRRAVLDHGILVNTVVTTESAQPFLTDADLGTPDRRLATVVDVTCDVTSENNRLPVNHAVTTWEEPFRRLTEVPAPLDLAAIGNLPALAPRESSREFSVQLLPCLEALGEQDPRWARVRRRFNTAMAGVGR